MKAYAMTSRQLLMLTGLLVALVLLTIYLILSEPNVSTVGVTPATFPSTVQSILEPDPISRAEIISRLREILRIREEAYRSRRDDLLASIYSRDCPCLSSDGGAIRELIRNRRVWDGIGTSIEVHGVTRLNERVWTIVGLFRSQTLYIRTEGGRLVRTEPPGVDLLKFTLVKPRDEQEWFLGLVSAIGGSR